MVCSLIKLAQKGNGKKLKCSISPHCKQTSLRHHPTCRKKELNKKPKNYEGISVNYKYHKNRIKNHIQ